jgi:TP901 family phage tail tape measure protein
MASEKFDFSVIFRVINKATAPLSKVGTAFGKVGVGVKKMTREMKRARAETKKTQAAMKGMGGALGGMGLGRFAGVAGATLFAKSTFDATLSFQESMNKVVAITGATGDSFDKLSAQAKKLGATTQFSASESAQAMTFLGMAGLNTKQIMDAMPGTLQLAAAGGLELATAADIATNVMTATGKSAADLAHINDVLAKTATSSNTDIMQMAEALRNVAPMGTQAGVSLEQMSAMIGKMADAGERGGAAGTFMMNAFLAMIKPNKAMIDLMGELGTNIGEFVDESGKIKNFDILMKKIQKKGVNTGKIFKAFGIRGAKAVGLLTAKGKDLKDFTEVLKNSDGTAQKMADTMMRGLPGAVKTLKSAFEGFQLSLTEGDSKLELIISSMAKMLQVATESGSIIDGLTAGFNKLDDAFSGWVTDLADSGNVLAKWFEVFLEDIPNAINDAADALANFFGGVPSFFKNLFGAGETTAETAAPVAGGARGNVAAFSEQAGEAIKETIEKSETKSQVNILVQAAEGSEATVEDVIKKKGDPKIKTKTNSTLNPVLFTARGGLR